MCARTPLLLLALALALVVFVAPTSARRTPMPSPEPSAEPSPEPTPELPAQPNVFALPDKVHAFNCTQAENGVCFCAQTLANRSDSRPLFVPPPGYYACGYSPADAGNVPVSCLAPTPEATGEVCVRWVNTIDPSDTAEQWSSANFKNETYYCAEVIDPDRELDDVQCWSSASSLVARRSFVAVVAVVAALLAVVM